MMPSKIGSVNRGFESVPIFDKTMKLSISEIEGEFPKDITGSLYFNGPGRNEVYGEPYGHWFEGDGLVTRINFGSLDNSSIEILSR